MIQYSLYKTINYHCSLRLKFKTYTVYNLYFLKTRTYVPKNIVIVILYSHEKCLHSSCTSILSFFNFDQCVCPDRFPFDFDVPPGTMYTHAYVCDSVKIRYLINLDLYNNIYDTYVWFIVLRDGETFYIVLFHSTLTPSLDRESHAWDRCDLRGSRRRLIFIQRINPCPLYRWTRGQGHGAKDYISWYSRIIYIYTILL